MQKKLKKHIGTALIHTLGWIFILLGIVGLVVPILPGVLFLLAGIYLLSLRIIWIRNHVEKFLNKYPKIKKEYLGIELYLCKTLHISQK